MMSDRAIRSVVIVGGGTAGWMSAAVLSRFFAPGPMTITLVESEEIGTIGVGEATVPLMQHYNGVLGIDENEFVAATNGSYKLGIEFRDWGKPGNVHFHGFGDYGDSIGGASPHHHWLKLRQAGDPAPIDDYSFPYAAARRGRFAPPVPQASNAAAHFRYAFHFDAALYAAYLRRYSEARGATRIEGRVADVALEPLTGAIQSLTLADGRKIAGDFFIDCTGFVGLLIEKAMQTGYEDWSHWLPCDRAVVVPTSNDGPPPPFTLSTAQEAGWQWRIPLQHRVGNGYVYASGFTDEQRAQDVLLKNVRGEPLADPRLLRFVTGHRKKFWNRNCLAVGLSGGFMEPLESTSIQLIQTTLARLIEMFPDRDFDPVMIAEFNRVTTNEFARIRDFLILHYSPSQREEALWRHCSTMPIPDSLAHKIEVWNACGRVALLTEESYQEPSWVAVFLGNGMIPRRYDPVVDRIDPARLAEGLRHRRDQLARLAEGMPLHQAYIDRHSKARVAA